MDAFGDLRAYLVGALEVLLGGGHEAVEAAEGGGEDVGYVSAYVEDVEAHEEAREGGLAAAVNGV